MLRYLRCRWVEACCSLPPAADAADGKLQAALLRWQYVGRDACARHMAFACPSRAALSAALRATARGGDSLVELGCGNGYWSKLLARHMEAGAVRALDVQPPPAWRQPSEARVAFGTADDLATGGERTLLICMPSPGEPGIAEDALEAFAPHGEYVIYVGEWCSGMTGTKAMHAMLLRDYALLATRPLPCMPLARLALHIFRRRHSTSRSGGARDAPAAAASAPRNARCAACGGFKGVRACPWTRQLLVCSEACHVSAEAQHREAIALTFCGAEAGSGHRPAFAAFEACEHLEVSSASDQQWLRLAEATPQPERELPVG